MKRFTTLMVCALAICLASTTALAVAIPNPFYYPFDTTIVVPEDGKVGFTRLDTTVRYTRMHYPEGGGYEDFELARTPGSTKDHLIFYGAFTGGSFATHNREIEYEIKKHGKKVYMQVSKIHITKTWTGRVTRYEIDSMQLVFDTIPHLGDESLYYPLAHGNRWDYKTMGGTTGSISRSRYLVQGDTTFSNGKTYAIIGYAHTKESYFPDTAAFKSKTFERSAGSRIYQYDPHKKAEYPLCDFSMKVGDTLWYVTYTATRFDSGCIILMSKSRKDFWGRKSQVFSFFVNPSKMIADEEFSLEMADSLGRTRSGSVWGYSTVLTGAIIDGKHYGDSPGVLPEYSATAPRSGFAFTIQNQGGQIRFFGNRSLIGKLQVFNSFGQCVWSFRNHSAQSSLVWEAKGAPAGIYLTRAELGERVFVQRIRYLR